MMREGISKQWYENGRLKAMVTLWPKNRTQYIHLWKTTFGDSLASQWCPEKSTSLQGRKTSLDYPVESARKKTQR